MSRNILDVMDKIKEVTTCQQLTKDITRIENGAGFCAPELEYQLWNTLYYKISETYETPFINDESLEVFSIFIGRTKEELLKIQKQEQEKIQFNNQF